MVDYKSRKAIVVAVAVATAVVLSLFALDAHAAISFKTQTSGWKDQIDSILAFAKVVFGAIGLFVFAGGIFMIHKDSKQPGQGHLKTGIAGLFIGSCLMILPWLIGLFTESVAPNEGDNATKLANGAGASL